jgi:hypothetical protein
MKDEQTICYKVSEAIKEVEKAIATQAFDVGKMAKLLHAIRQDAQHMENGLKLRKSLMVEAGIEEKYQAEKKKAKTPGGINEIYNKEEYTKERKTFDFIVKESETGKVVYQNTSFAGVLSTVEEIKDIDRNGEIDGQTQVFHFGHPLAFWFAFDQLRQSIEARKVEVLSALKEAVLSNKLVDLEVRKQIVNCANQVKGEKND